MKWSKAHKMKYNYLHSISHSTDAINENKLKNKKILDENQKTFTTLTSNKPARLPRLKPKAVMGKKKICQFDECFGCRPINFNAFEGLEKALRLCEEALKIKELIWISVYLACDV
ncbi:CLUMA_CG013044, isoform A [Clunio marinus]|uniref:CLUMA_CG013044, isoform A n=1 Tax=Clunio marinus TaxID=568069 RepID=A0A1J1IMH6_9DIPT|nr:CLUMA_CG013044, isoform A [Clunio marinus]